jgi:hypothetical protein
MLLLADIVMPTKLLQVTCCVGSTVSQQHGLNSGLGKNSYWSVYQASCSAKIIL